MSNTIEKQTLRQFILGTKFPPEIERLKADFRSKKWYTHILQKPSRATHADLLIFEKHLDLSAYELHTKFGLAKLSELELAQLQTLHNLTQQSAEAA